ncbi:MAG TPA: crosslink repair DNA glycosylase YcaQ family protein, partial [Anaerolineales bacterium]|nr:crosslink repair DNA glycosylase YcaQ family protein [Anaerolineales bacterium]
MADAKQGLNMLKPKLEHEMIDGQTYWFVEAALPAKAASTRAHLLPIYDEYVMGYKDRSAMLGAVDREKFSAGNIAFDNLIVIDGMLVGSWKRSLSKLDVSIETNFNARLTKAQQKAVAAAAAEYGRFLGLSPIVIQTENPTRISRQNFG